MESKVLSPFKSGGPLTAIDAINASNCGFSEELSRKVLTSLRGLSEAIGTVRDSVARIDHLAQNQNAAPSPSAPSPLGKPPAAPPTPETAVNPAAQQSSTVQLSQQQQQRSLVLESVLKRVCLSAAQSGVAATWDDPTWEQLRQVLDGPSFARIETARHTTASTVSAVPPLAATAPPPPPPSVATPVRQPVDVDVDEPSGGDVVTTPPVGRSGIEVLARPHGPTATPGAQTPLPTAGGSGSGVDPLAGDAEWPVPIPDGPRFVAFTLRVVYEAGRTGFEEVKDFQAPLGSVIAGRYRVKDYLGSAAFSTALSCEDLHTGTDVCLKVIKNNKDFLDQSLDEIKLLRYINTVGDADEHNVLILYEYFYHKEHLILVTELLKDNLYEFQKYLTDNKQEPYFTLPRLQKVAQQTLTALAFIHSKGLIHCDLKPENILIKSYSRCEIKVIDFGSSCYVTDHLSSYIQSRSYRAPEVILGLPYDFKIDIWSLGCIMAELLTGKVLFQNDSVQTMLARMMGVIGDFPERMMTEGRDVPKYFNSKGVVFERTEHGDGYVLLHPKKSSLQQRLKGADAGFLSFVEACLQLDPLKRPTAEEALNHPWFQQVYEFEPYVLG